MAKAKPKSKPKATSNARSPMGASEKAARDAYKNINFEEPSEQKVQEVANRQNEAALAAGRNLAKELQDPNAFRKVSEGRTDEEIEALRMLRDEYTSSRVRSADATLALDRLRAGMEGLNSQEGMALREQARRELDSQYRNMMAQARVNAARSGTRGAAANAQSLVLNRERARTQGQLEQDLVLQNFNLRRQGEQAFAGFVNQLEQNEAARRQGASTNLANQINSQTARDYDKQTFNINQDTNRSIQNSQNILGGAAIQAGLASSAYGNLLGANNLKNALELQKQEGLQAARANDAYVNSTNRMYNR